MLDVVVRHPLGRITLDVAFHGDGGLLALVGPSGAGKTSVLDVIAGVLRPAHARVLIDGDVVVDTASRQFVAPHRRRIGYACQEPRLFPHLTVKQNLLYGRWFTPARLHRVRIDEVVALLDLDSLLGRRPGRLSGGEKQRVALGRALLASPRLLLLDEPLASVDAGRRQEILPYLDRLRSELRMPTVYVTHLFNEISARAAMVVVLDEGRVVATGTADEVRAPLERTLGLAGR